MKTCQYIVLTDSFGDLLCDVRCEGNTDYCATHNRLIRKENELIRKSEETRKLKLNTVKPISKPIRKVSEKRKQLNKEYTKLADEFKRENPKCVVRANQYCTGKTESVHHKRGRGRYLLDVSTFLPCCLSCHTYIEAHPQEAKEKGWSESRLAKQEPTV